jgi:hypothetical protein
VDTRRYLARDLTRRVPPASTVLIGLAIAFGVVVAAVDNLALAGEVSPVVVDQTSEY